jgi:hypothetical protein
MSKQNSVGGWIVAVIVVLGVVAAGVYLARRALQPTSAPNAATSTSAPSGSVPATAGTAIQHPISQAAAPPAAASSAPLPALDDSDADVAAALSSLAGGGDLRAWLLPQQIIPRIVATIDSLPRRELGTLMLPARTPKGNFIVASGDAGVTMSDRNIERYAPYMQVVENVDTEKLVAWYVHAYPLFQEAYRQLGYPKGYFNDRLIVVIDNLLDAPDLAQPAALAPSKSFYTYADPTLESLSAGQKLLIRTGPANEAGLKAKLREIRSSLVGQKLPASRSSATGG